MQTHGEYMAHDYVTRLANRCRMMRRIDSSIAVEREFGIIDHYIREKPMLGRLRVAMFALIHDQKMGDWLKGDWGIELLDRMLRSAVRHVNNVLKPAWAQRAAEDETVLSNTIKHHASEAQRKQNAKTAKRADLEDLAQQWTYSADELRMIGTRGKTKQKQWAALRYAHLCTGENVVAEKIVAHLQVEDVRRGL
jgi:hypothetical protein